ncbi:MAG: hypothetical protein CMB67_02850 [Euryarchaeota archaeon]|nr:hypothetical protein [Euryarchaeota archaeon]
MGEGLEGGPIPMGRPLEIPVSVVPTEAIRAMRVIGENRGWRMSRFEESTMVQRWAIIVPIANRARVFGLSFGEGAVEGLSIRSWSYVPGSAGRLSFVSFRIPESMDDSEWRELLNEWVNLLPRCPWKWTFMERSVVGYLLPEFRKSRKIFSQEGVDINGWKEIPG